MHISMIYKCLTLCLEGMIWKEKKRDGERRFSFLFVWELKWKRKEEKWNEEAFSPKVNISSS